LRAKAFELTGSWLDVTKAREALSRARQAGVDISFESMIDTSSTGASPQREYHKEQEVTQQPTLADIAQLISGLSHRLEAVERGEPRLGTGARRDLTSRDESMEELEVDSYEVQLRTAAKQIAVDSGWIQEEQDSPAPNAVKGVFGGKKSQDWPKFPLSSNTKQLLQKLAKGKGAAQVIDRKIKRIFRLKEEDWALLLPPVPEQQWACRVQTRTQEDLMTFKDEKEARFDNVLRKTELSLSHAVRIVDSSMMAASASWENLGQLRSMLVDAQAPDDCLSLVDKAISATQVAQSGTMEATALLCKQRDLLTRQRRQAWLAKADLIPDLTKKAADLPMELGKWENQSLVAPPLGGEKVWALINERYKCQKQLDKMGRRVQELKRKEVVPAKAPPAKKFKWNQQPSTKASTKSRDDSSRGRGTGKRSKPSHSEGKPPQKGSKKF
jgi:hypothetical protein